MATFYPADNAINVSPIKPIITITFGSAIYSAFESEGTAFKPTTLKTAFVFKKTNTDGDDVECTMSIDDTNKIVTITPTDELVDGQKYYVAIVANKVYTASETPESAASADWTVGVLEGTKASINNITPVSLVALNVDESTFDISCSDEELTLVAYNSSADTDYDLTVLAPIDGQYAATTDDKKVEIGNGKIGLVNIESSKYVDKKGRLRIKAENAALKIGFLIKK